MLPSDKIATLFALEGIFMSLTANIIGNNNNLFATRMGASDFQISLVVSLPQFVGMLALIPGGIISDRLTNKRRMVITVLSCLAVIYSFIGFVPLLGEYRLGAYFVLLALSAGPMTMYNASWQAYFSDVTPREDINRIYSLRTKCTFIVAIAAPLATGAILVSAHSVTAKIGYHQGFFWTASFLLVIEMLVINRIPGGNVQPQRRMRLVDLKEAAVALVNDKRYMGFLYVAVFFYMSWQIDWTLYYLGQVNYLKFNEQWLSYVIVGGAAVQLFAVGFWSRLNERRGVRFSIILGNLGLAIYPIAMIVAVNLPVKLAGSVFLTLIVLAGFGFTTITLNILQCLLQVVPERNKTLSISVYSVLITLSNVVMPMAGVGVYTVLGASKSALQTTYLIIFVFRIISTGLWTLRWWLLRKEPK